MRCTGRAACAALLLVVPGFVLQEPAPADASAMRALVDQYFAAFAAEDHAAFASIWHTASPDASTKKALATSQFFTYDFRFSGIGVARWASGPEGPVARVIANARITDTRRKQAENVTWLRDFVFRQEEGAWRIWREESPVDSLAALLEKAATEEERLAILDREPDLVAEPLRAALSRRANAAYMKRDNVSSEGLLKLAATVAERAKDPRSQWSAWVDLGLHYQALEDLQKATESLAKARDYLAAAGETARLGDTEMNLAGIRYKQAVLEQDEKARFSLYSEAAGHYRRALAAYEAVGETGWHASILHSLGNTSYLLGQWDQALDYYKRTLAIQEQALAEAGEKRTMLQVRGVAAAHQAIGMVLKEQADYPSAFEALSRSLAAYASFDDRSGMVNVERELGEVCRLEGDFTLALSHFLSALDMAVKIRADARDPVNEAKLLAEIGEVYALEQRYAVALGYLQKSLEIFERAGEREAVATVLGGMGGAHFLAGSFDLALESYKKSLSVREELKDDRGAALTFAQTGLVLKAQEKLPEARASFARSLERARAAGERWTMAVALTLSAEAACAADSTDEALELAARAYTLAKEVDDLDIAIRAKIAEGDARRLRSELSEAEAALSEAVALADRVREAGIRSDERFFNDTIAPFIALVNLLLEQQRTGDASDLLERARQVRMQGILKGARVVKGLSAEEREEESRLEKRVVSLRRQLRKASEGKDAGAARLAQLSAELVNATAAHKEYEDRLYASRPELQVLRARGETATPPRSAEAAIDSSTALLEYAVTETATWLLATTLRSGGSGSSGSEASPGEASAAGESGAQKTRDEGAASPLDVAVFRIDMTPAELAKRVSGFRTAIAERTDDCETRGQELWALLLQPAAAQISGKRRLLIVPDGSLWALPFQALRSAAGRYVIEDAAVAYGLSLTALAASAERQADRQATEFDVVAAGLAAAGPAASRHLSLARPDLKFAPMLEAEREAKSVGALFPPGRARVHAGPAALAEKVAADASKAAILHLALPAVLVDASPLHSLIAFSAPEKREARATPLLEASDVMDWDVTARTVLLSRVHGDPGQQNIGAGAHAVVWSWFVAGVPTTVMTSWVVDATSTVTLVRNFVRNVSRAPAPPAAASPDTARPARTPSPSLRASEALRRATLPLLEGPSRHPYFWAGFSVFGDSR
ncbi:MAG: CHAT domain-containing protein [Vicinamibacterales bacterium]